MPRLAWVLLTTLLASGCLFREREADRPYTAGVARVEAIDVRVSPGAPPMAWVRVRGFLPDACTEIDAAETSRLGNHLDVVLTTRRPFGAGCTAGLVSFEHRVPLQIEEPGLYLLDVNGVRATFRAQAAPGPTQFHSGAPAD